VIFVSCVSLFLVSGLSGVVVPFFVYGLHCLLGSLTRVVCVSDVSLFLVLCLSGMVSFPVYGLHWVSAWEFSRDVCGCYFACVLVSCILFECIGVLLVHGLHEEFVYGSLTCSLFVLCVSLSLALYFSDVMSLLVYGLQCTIDATFLTGSRALFTDGQVSFH